MNRNLFELPNLVLNWPRYYKNHVLPWLLQRPDKRYHDLLLSKMQFESGNFLTSLLLLLLRIMALIFMTLFPKGTQYVKLIAIVNEPFPTGAKQRDQAALFTMTAARMNDINLRKETSENTNIPHQNLIPGFGNFRRLEGSLIITYWIDYFQPFPTGAKQRDHTITFAMASIRMNYYYERAHAEVRRKGLRDNNILYQEGLQKRPLFSVNPEGFLKI